jgi:subfamily B ATP-binding cassette protein MsbA
VDYCFNDGNSGITHALTGYPNTTDNICPQPMGDKNLMSNIVPFQDNAAAIREVIEYRPAFDAGKLSLSFIAAILEGIGLSFILPIVEFARGAESSDPSALMHGFLMLYETAVVPFTLEYIILGVTVVIFARYTSTLFAWLRASLRTSYVEHLRHVAP